MASWVVYTVHWVHVLTGIFWAGGMLFISLVLWPALLRQPAPEAQRLYKGMEPFIGRLMGATGLLVIIAGILRGTWLGPLRSWAALVQTGYGLTFIAAFGILIVLMAVHGVFGANLEARVWQGGQFEPGAGRYLLRLNGFTVVALLLLIACMVRLRFGG